MSEGDQDCLLAYLWGFGSAPVLNDLSDNNNVSTSYDFVKTMNLPDPLTKRSAIVVSTKEVEPQPMPLTYAHLAVSPREIVEADAIDWRTGTAAIVITTKESDKETIYVDEGKNIYESIRKKPQFETIMRLLRESELLFYEGNETIELVFVPKDGGNELFNVGPKGAMQSILSFGEYASAAAGNLPLLCKQNRKKKRNYYEVEVGEKVKEAFGRQKDLPECLQRDQSNYNFLPYMSNVLVMDWFSILETHLFRINCSNYGRWNMLRFRKNITVGMEGLRMEDTMHAIFDYSVNEKELEKDEKRRETVAKLQNRESREWWHMWLDSYHKELKDNGGNEEYKDIREEIIHKKYDVLRKRERKRPPTEWLMKNKLQTCS